MEFLGKVLAFSLKLDLGFPHQSQAEEWLFYCVFNKKKEFYLEIVIFSWVVEVLENILAFSLKLYKKELLKYHESSPILVSQGSVSIEMAL